MDSTRFGKILCIRLKIDGFLAKILLKNSGKTVPVGWNSPQKLWKSKKLCDADAFLAGKLLKNSKKTVLFGWISSQELWKSKIDMKPMSLWPDFYSKTLEKQCFFSWNSPQRLWKSSVGLFLRWKWCEEAAFLAWFSSKTLKMRLNSGQVCTKISKTFHR